MQYQKFEQGTWHFPRPMVPALPTLGRHSIRPAKSSAASLLGRLPNTRLYARSRYALADAYRLCGVGSDSTLLAPAYHCRTMLDPAIRLQADVQLYPLLPNLAADLRKLDACVAGCTKPVAAILVTHYFGYPHALGELLDYCNRRGIALIEDCSHCLLASQSDSASIGRQGRYSVWSPYKFFPCDDGGILWANHDAPLPDAQPRLPSLLMELKGFMRSLQRGWENQAKPNPELLDKRIEDFRSNSTSSTNDVLNSSEVPSIQYDLSLEGMESLSGSRWIMQHTDIDRVATNRRQNYERWATIVAKLPHCHALYPTLPDGCVPYMFPLFIECPQVHFLALKSLGMTEWRWDDMAVSSCPVATAYRLKLLHLPCHQELTTHQMDWMVAAVTKVLTHIPVGHS
jgi:perosamine synthetase